MDYYPPLLRAVARLDRTSYEARGAIYDRALTALVKRMASAVPPYSEADIDMELLAFRAAVRRVEFGDLDERDRLTQQAMTDRAADVGSRDLADQAPQQNARPGPLQAVRQATTAAELPEPTPDPVAAQLAAAPAAAILRRRPVFGRVAGRMVLATVLVAGGIAGYAYEAGQFDLSSLGRILDRVAVPAWLWRASGSSAELTEPAMYYERAKSSAPWRELAGNARWRTRLEEASGAARKPDAVLTLEVLVPERALSMAISIRRDASENAAITHLIELAFSDPQGEPVDAITGVASVVMKPEDAGSGNALIGRSIKVAPGLFLFGLSAETSDARRNNQALTMFSRVEILITYANGATGVISVDKGASGERAFGEAFADWTR